MIRVEYLTKRCGSVKAVKDLTFTVDILDRTLRNHPFHRVLENMSVGGREQQGGISPRPLTLVAAGADTCSKIDKLAGTTPPR